MGIVEAVFKAVDFDVDPVFDSFWAIYLRHLQAHDQDIGNLFAYMGASVTATGQLAQRFLKFGHFLKQHLCLGVGAEGFDGEAYYLVKLLAGEYGAVVAIVSRRLDG